MFHEFDELAKSMDEVIKAGEGTRGGKVVGHTSSGKPIYASKMEHIDSGVHSSYTAKDHKEAANHHAHDEKMQKFHHNWQELKGKPMGKSLSHNPFEPVEMSSESSYYNPYRMVDGAFLPHPTAYWREQGKLAHVDSYNQTDVFFSTYFGKSQALKNFADTVGSDLVKGGAVPVGTVHTYKNGDKFKKVGEGQWQPVGEVKVKTPDHATTEKDAGHVAKIRDAIKAKYKDQESVQAHTTAGHAQLKEFAHAIFGDELPEGVKAHLDKKEKELSKPNVHPSAVKPIKEIQRHFTKKHKVNVTFKINGQPYTHSFENVNGGSQDEVSNTVTEMIKKKIPGAQITRVHVAVDKEDVDKQKNNYQKELKGDKDGSTKQTRV